MSSAKPLARIALSISTRPGRPARENPAYRGVAIAMDELKADQGLPVRLDWEMFDDFGDPARSATLAGEIVAEPTFIGVVGPMGSTEAFANAPVFHQGGIVHVSPCASHPDLCRRGYQTFFRLVANEDVQGRELARMAYGYLKANRLAVVHADDTWASTVSDIVIREYQQLGGKVVERQKTAARAIEDITDLVRATVASEPEAVFFAVHPLEGPPVSRGLRAAGLKVPFLGTDAMKTTFPLGGGREDEEVYHTHSGADFRQLPCAAAFRKAYAARYPEDSTYSPEGYDGVMIIAEALRRAGIADRGRVLEEMRNLRNFQGVSGVVNFDPTGERIDAPISFYRVRPAGGGLEMEYVGVTVELL